MMAACDENGVLLMDGVMFMHNKRLLKLCEEFHEQLGSMRARPLRITSAFSFYGDRAFFESDIRTKPDADPLGCLGDLGWYCVRFAMCCMRVIGDSLVFLLHGLREQCKLIVTTVWEEGGLEYEL